jgi:hypothetical protein
MTATQRDAFESAAARWQQVITGDLPDVPMSVPAAACGPSTPSFNLSVDDLLIFASVENIDGPGSFLGFGGWCYRRSGSLPVVGFMRFDLADMPFMESNGLLQPAIRHEMGHVLGVGTLWSNFGLLVNPSPVGGPPLDTYFSGSGGIAGFNSIGGSTYTGGQKVPVENSGPSGTVNVHWRESVLANELMTGYIDSDSPLSLLTVRSLGDLGYLVNTANADPFFLTLTLRGGAAPVGVRLEGDVDPLLRQYTVDPRGRATRVR